MRAALTYVEQTLLIAEIVRLLPKSVARYACIDVSCQDVSHPRHVLIRDQNYWTDARQAGIVSESRIQCVDDHSGRACTGT